MEATQAFELDSDTAEPGSSGAAEVGCLTVEYPDRAPDAFPLFTGANVVGRSSSEPDRDRELLDGWQEEGVVQCVHGIPLHSNSISAQHAVLYLEGNGAFCFIKDLKSRNKTQIERQGNKIQLASDDRYGLSSGDTIRFGALSCRVTFAPAAERPGLPGAADLATQAYGLVGDEDDKENSPTGDTPAAVAASGAGASESGQVKCSPAFSPSLSSKGASLPRLGPFAQDSDLPPKSTCPAQPAHPLTPDRYPDVSPAHKASYAQQPQSAAQQLHLRNMDSKISSYDTFYLSSRSSGGDARQHAQQAEQAEDADAAQLAGASPWLPLSSKPIATVVASLSALKMPTSAFSQFALEQQCSSPSSGGSPTSSSSTSRGSSLHERMGPGSGLAGLIRNGGSGAISMGRQPSLNDWNGMPCGPRPARQPSLHDWFGSPGTSFAFESAIAEVSGEAGEGSHKPSRFLKPPARAPQSPPSPDLAKLAGLACAGSPVQALGSPAEALCMGSCGLHIRSPRCVICIPEDELADQMLTDADEDQVLGLNPIVSSPCASPTRRGLVRNLDAAVGVAVPRSLTRTPFSRERSPAAKRGRATDAFNPRPKSPRLSSHAMASQTAKCWGGGAGLGSGGEMLLAAQEDLSGPGFSDLYTILDGCYLGR